MPSGENRASVEKLAAALEFDRELSSIRWLARLDFAEFAALIEEGVNLPIWVEAELRHDRRSGRGSRGRHHVQPFVAVAGLGRLQTYSPFMSRPAEDEL